MGVSLEGQPYELVFDTTTLMPKGFHCLSCSGKFKTERGVMEHKCPKRRVKYIYHLGRGSKKLENLITSMTFPTKKETAEHYPFYLYIPEAYTWRAPINANDPNWSSILKMEHILGLE